MANLILLQVTKRVSGTNDKDFSPAVGTAFDVNDIVSPIRFSAGTNESYFDVRLLSGAASQGRNNAIVSYRCSNTLSSIASQADTLVVLNVVSRRGITMNSEAMVFVTSRVSESFTPVTAGTKFYYIEDGDPDPVEYIVSQTPAAIVASGIAPIYSMDGRDLYVNDKVGNNATAEKGNPILPWATVDAAIAAAVAGDTVVILEGSHLATNNLYKNGVNVEVRTNTALTIPIHTSSGVGNQTIYGGGKIITQNAGFRMSSTFSGTIKVDIGTWEILGSQGLNNTSHNNGVFDLAADYVIVDDPTDTVAFCEGNGSFNWRVKIKQIDNSLAYKGCFVIHATNTNSTLKTFDINIANCLSYASNEGFLLLYGIDDTYVVNVDGVIVYDGSNGSPCFNAIFAAYQCVGGQLIINGTHNALSGRIAIIVDSPLLKVIDHSISYQDAANGDEAIIMSGGASIYKLIGNKRSFAATSAIVLGEFTGANDLDIIGGPVVSTGGADILWLKGGLKCATLSGAAVGILVETDGLVVDGGIIEMVNGISNEAFSAPNPQNMKVYGTGFTNGVVNSNLTNLVSGTNIISDPNVVVNT